MVEYNDDRLNAVFHALADPTRRSILKRVARREYTISEIAAPFDMSLAAVSKHIQVLEKAQLLSKEKEGRTYWCQMNYQPMKAMSLLIQEYEQFWKSQLDSLEKYLEETNDKESSV